MRLENPRDRKRRPGRLERHLIVGRQTLSEKLELLGRALHPPSQPQPRLVSDRDLTEVAMHIQRHRSHVAAVSQRNVDAVLASITAYNAEDLDAQMETTRQTP